MTGLTWPVSSFVPCNKLVISNPPLSPPYNEEAGVVIKSIAQVEGLMFIIKPVTPVLGNMLVAIFSNVVVVPSSWFISEIKSAGLALISFW